MNIYFTKNSIRNFAIVFVSAFTLFAQSASSSENEDGDKLELMKNFIAHMDISANLVERHQSAEAEIEISQAIALLFHVTHANDAPELVNTICAMEADDELPDRMGSFSAQQSQHYTSVMGNLQIACAHLTALQKYATATSCALTHAQEAGSHHLPTLKGYSDLIIQYFQTAALETGKLVARLICSRSADFDLPAASNVGTAQVCSAATAGAMQNAQGQYNAVLATVAAVMGGGATNEQAQALIEGPGVKLLNIAQLIELFQSLEDDDESE